MVCPLLCCREEMEPAATVKKEFNGPSGLLRSHELYKYVLEMSVYPREAEPLKELREATLRHPRAFLSTAPDTGQFLELILKLTSARKTIELGVFTGYSLLVTALSIPDDGKVVAIDVDRETYEGVGLPFIKRANVENKIEFVESQALPALDLLLQKEENEGSFDFAFVDADKANLKDYHERLMRLVRVGGIIVYDNTLWGGFVVLPDAPAAAAPEIRDAWKDVVEFNKTIAADRRVDVSQVALGDGITICRRVY